MPTIRLTQLAVDKLKPPPEGRLVYWDRTLPGFGLRLTARGARSWIAKYRVAGTGKAVMETIAPVAKLPKVEDAREAARTSMQRAETGVNPVEEKRTAAGRARVNTVRISAERWLAEARDANGHAWKPKTVREYKRIFDHDVFPRWAERPVGEIAKADVLELLKGKACGRERRRKHTEGGAAIQAGKMLTRLRTFFGWCLDQNLIDADPTLNVRRPAKEAERDRVLSDEEIVAFWGASEALGMPFGPVCRLLLLTAQRENEVAGLRWSELDNARNPTVWEIPGTRTKNSKSHIVHLSPLAVEIIRAVPEIAGQELLFSGNGITPVSGFSSAKDRLDAAMLRSMLQNRDEDTYELQPWVFQDLRRTATTGMARLGIQPHVADRVLNHVAGQIRGVARIYNRFEYLQERKAALEAWGRYVQGLVASRSS